MHKLLQALRETEERAKEARLEWRKATHEVENIELQMVDMLIRRNEIGFLKVNRARLNQAISRGWE